MAKSRWTPIGFSLNKTIDFLSQFLHSCFENISSVCSKVGFIKLYVIKVLLTVCQFSGTLRKHFFVIQPLKNSKQLFWTWIRMSLIHLISASGYGQERRICIRNHDNCNWNFNQVVETLDIQLPGFKFEIYQPLIQKIKIKQIWQRNKPFRNYYKIMKTMPCAFADAFCNSLTLVLE